MTTSKKAGAWLPSIRDAGRAVAHLGRRNAVTGKVLSRTSVYRALGKLVSPLLAGALSAHSDRSLPPAVIRFVTLCGAPAVELSIFKLAPGSWSAFEKEARRVTEALAHALGQRTGFLELQRARGYRVEMLDLGDAPMPVGDGEEEE